MIHHIQSEFPTPPERHNATLPNIIRHGVERFESEHEQTIFLYSMLTVASSLLVNVTGLYGRDVVRPNSFLMIAGPPATGKGVMLHSRNCIQKIHRGFEQRSQQARVEYEQLLQASKESKGAIPTPGRPPLCVVVIPGNITSIRLIEHLAANTEKHCPAVLIESEIDTLTQASRGEHGGFSDILRQSFHNEPVKVSRKQDDRYIEIELPQLAAALSGTVGQVINMIKSSEDGLFTRFLVHYLEKPSEWRDVTPCEGCYSHADFFERQADQWWDFWQFTKDKPLEVKLSDDQWATLNYYFTEEHADAIEAGNVHCLGIVTRHGVMLFKLAMTLTALRRWQDNAEDSVRTCSDEDFNMSWSLIAESLSHSKRLYSKLPNAPVSPSDDKKRRFYNALPNPPATFKTWEAALIAEGFNMKKRTWQRYLKDFVQENKLERTEHGHYRKNTGGGNGVEAS